MLALDPLFIDNVTWGDFGVLAVKVIISFVVLLVATMFMVWFERKVIAGMQNRIGPNKAGPWGLLQTLADGTKLYLEGRNIPGCENEFASYAHGTKAAAVISASGHSREPRQIIPFRTFQSIIIP